MKFRIEVWSIGDLIKKYESKTLNLNPDYQRRFIWTLNDQKTLIKSIFSGYAVPNIFLYDKGSSFEVVDGQQRIRTILGFYLNQFKSSQDNFYDEKSMGRQFRSYQIPITIIESIEESESIEEFYSLVNSAGIHLNRPELKKAEYFDTIFLKLVNELADNKSFKDLMLFTQSSSKRMNDLDFVSELVTLMILGITDKKLSVDKLFEKDISNEDYDKYKSLFNEVIEIFSNFNSIFPIKQTRYKQRNDFYTLFEFIISNKKFGNIFLNKVYDSLVLFNDYIVPSNEKCEPFQEYAFHCISQSNSKNAREARKKILNKLFINKKEKPTKEQRQVVVFFKIDIKLPLIDINECHIINTEYLNNQSTSV